MVVTVDFANNLTRKTVSVSDETPIREVMEQLGAPEATSYMLNGVTFGASETGKALRDIVEADAYSLRTVKPGDGNR